jgi:hypothetical protein
MQEVKAREFLDLTQGGDADRDAGEYMRKNGRDMEVEPPRRMMTRSQTKGPEAEYSASANDPT